MTLQVLIDLPDELGRKAKSNGLLKPEAVIGMIEDALRRKAAKRFLSLAPIGDDTCEPPLSDEEIVAEVKQRSRAWKPSGTRKRFGALP